ncbi:hypothetical protein Y032_0107g3819 [Ancylostoma ceylanicum]|uniref:Uncharacterized protein n=1 Tax=Ancylostoma ceylanicum TaxID=53326 RepID=A0A016TFN9_9BILA|nr:hypothetical protein Y032_0107g3819 [Ancylostoma ceylanicum]
MISAPRTCVLPAATWVTTICHAIRCGCELPSIHRLKRDGEFWSCIRTIETNITTAEQSALRVVRCHRKGMVKNEGLEFI